MKASGDENPAADRMPPPVSFMSDLQLTPEQEKQAQQAFAERRFDPEQYMRDILGPEAPPEVQVAIAEEDLRAMDPAAGRVERSAEDQDTLDQKRAQAQELAEEFCFLDPADFADEQAAAGRPLTPLEFWHKLKFGCGLECWFSLADEAQIAKELNPRDVALAVRKIGMDRRNLYDMERWRAAIGEVRQEEARRQPLCNYERFGLQVCRQPGVPEYVTWLPGCTLREYSLVKFDSHGVPDFYIPGWRDGLLALIRKQLLTQAKADEVFGEAVGPRSRRWHMILKGLRERPWVDEGENVPTTETPSHGEEPVLQASAPPQIKDEDHPAAAYAPCPECSWRYGVHQRTCSHYEQRPQILEPQGVEANG
jgi:hypothetical protein